MKMKFNLVILSIFLLAFSQVGFSQGKFEAEETYRDANSYFYFEDYEEALALYRSIYKSFPNNSNIDYRIGFCYLNIPGSKYRAIPYLKKAITATTKFYNEESIVEKKAPIDVYFYLGNAFFINNQIDSALKYYQEFHNLTKGKGNWDFEYLNHQIQTAKNSEILKKSPINFIESKLGDNINNQLYNYNAVVSGNGKILAYTTKQKFYDAIMVAKLNSDGQWGKPQNITLDLQVNGTCKTLSLSYNGNELYLFKDDNHDGNIYVSRFEDNRWQPMVKLNSNINSEAYETHACPSPDGKSLYFTSNRPGGYGELDIYVSKRTEGLDWGKPQNLGDIINTPLNEDTPFVTSDGEMLFFSSEGHNNMGGYDVFVSQINDQNQWSTPINIGYPINTTDDDLFFFPTNKGSQALVSLFNKKGTDRDIYSIDLFIPRYRKSIVLSSQKYEHPSEAAFQRLIVDTLSQKGKAIVDPTSSNINIDFLSNTENTLYLKGKPYDILLQLSREELKPSNGNISSIELANNERKITPVIDTTTNKKDSINSSPIKERISLIKKLSDTNNTVANFNNAAKSVNTNQLVDKSNDLEGSYLMEMLLLLTNPKDYSILTPVLKRNWIFPAGFFNESIIKFSNSFKSQQEKDAMTLTLSKFLDQLVTPQNISAFAPRKRSQSAKDINTFNYVFNRMVNMASPELGKKLAYTKVNHDNIQTINELIVTLKKEQPEIYHKYSDELLRILTQISFETYKNLPDNKKIELYNSIGSSTIIPTSNRWWIYLIIALVIALASFLTYRIYKKR